MIDRVVKIDGESDAETHVKLACKQDTKMTSTPKSEISNAYAICFTTQGELKSSSTATKVTKAIDTK